MTPREQWRDLLSGERARRDDFKRRATRSRKEWLKARKDRRWVDALLHKDREQEYRRSAAQCDAFIKENIGKAQ